MCTCVGVSIKCDRSLSLSCCRVIIVCVGRGGSFPQSHTLHALHDELWSSVSLSVRGVFVYTDRTFIYSTYSTKHDVATSRERARVGHAIN